MTFTPEPGGCRARTTERQRELCDHDLGSGTADPGADHRHEQEDPGVPEGPQPERRLFRAEDRAQEMLTDDAGHDGADAGRRLEIERFARAEGIALTVTVSRAEAPPD